MRCLLRLKTTGWLQTSKPAGKEAQPPQRASGSRSKRQQRKQRCARYARVCVHVVSTASTLLPSSTQPSLTPPFTPCSSCSSGLFLFVLWLFVPSFFSNFFFLCLGRLWFAEAKKASGSHAAVHVPSPRYPRFKGGWLLPPPLMLIDSRFERRCQCTNHYFAHTLTHKCFHAVVGVCFDAQLNHLLKSPFVVHPKTGMHVCLLTSSSTALLSQRQNSSHATCTHFSFPLVCFFHLFRPGLCAD